MRLLSAAAHLSTFFPKKYVPSFNKYLIGPLFNGPVIDDSTVVIDVGPEGLLIADHPDQYR